MLRLILVIAVITVIVGVWELDEIMMLHVIRKHKGEIEWSIPDMPDDFRGFGVTLNDGTRFIVHLKGHMWEYLIREMDQVEPSMAWDCIEDIKRHTYITRFLTRVGIIKM